MSDPVDTKRKPRPKQRVETHAYLNDRHLTRIPEISEETVILYLHSNDIIRMDGLDNLRNLTHLYLQSNRLGRIENLENLVSLKKLYVGDNRIGVIEKLERLPNLKELHIQSQKLDSGENVCFEPRCLAGLRSLKVLNISDNRLSRFDEIARLKSLQTLVASQNRFADHEDICKHLNGLPYIKDVDFTGNPMCRRHRYKEKIIAACHRLESIDGKAVTEDTRRFLKGFITSSKVKFNKDPEDRYAKNRRSPDTQLSLLEEQRSASIRASTNRRKVIADTTGLVPRCFWRNKTETVRRNQTKSPFDDLMKKTEWP